MARKSPLVAAKTISSYSGLSPCLKWFDFIPSLSFSSKSNFKAKPETSVPKHPTFPQIQVLFFLSEFHVTEFSGISICPSNNLIIYYNTIPSPSSIFTNKQLGEFLLTPYSFSVIPTTRVSFSKNTSILSFSEKSSNEGPANLKNEFEPPENLFTLQSSQFQFLEHFYYLIYFLVRLIL